MARTQYCRENIDKVAKECHLGKSTVSDVKQADRFCQDESVFSDCSTDAIVTLIRVRDERVRQKAISLARNALSRATPTGGKVKKVLTTPEVKKIIKTAHIEIIGSEPIELFPATVPPAPCTVPFQADPALPPQPSLAEQMAPPVTTADQQRKEKFTQPEQQPAPAPAWSPEVCRTEKCPDGECHVERGTFGFKCRLSSNFIIHQEYCPIIRQKELAGEAGFVTASEMVNGGYPIKPAGIKIVPTPLTHDEAQDRIRAVVRGWFTKAQQSVWEDIRKSGELGETDLEILMGLVDRAGVQA